MNYGVMEPISIQTLVGFSLIVLCNLIAWMTKSVLKEKGYPSDLCWGHFRDFAMIHKAVTEENNQSEKKKLMIVRFLQYSIPLIFTMAVVLFFHDT